MYVNTIYFILYNTFKTNNYITNSHVIYLFIFIILKDLNIWLDSSLAYRLIFTLFIHNYVFCLYYFQHLEVIFFYAYKLKSIEKYNFFELFFII
jgi:hypothetical protein